MTSLRAVTASFEQIEKESAKVGLAVNGEKTKLMVSMRKTSSRLGPTVDLENYSFEVVKDFIYLGTAINKTNDISFETRRRIVMAKQMLLWSKYAV